MKSINVPGRALSGEAKEYLAKIAEWQARTGRTGLPPVWEDKRLSNWVQWNRAQYKRDKLRPDLEKALSDLGVVFCKPGETLCAVPRGLPDLLEAILRFNSEHNRCPRMLATTIDERRLGYWLVRIQADVVPSIYVPREPSQDLLRRLARLEQSLDHTQPICQMLAEWQLFAYAVQTCVDIRTAGDRWQLPLVELMPATVWERIGERARLEISMLERGLPEVRVLFAPPEVRVYLDHELQLGLRRRGRVVRSPSRLMGGQKLLGSLMLRRLAAAGVERSRIFRVRRVDVESFWWNSEDTLELSATG